MDTMRFFKLILVPNPLRIVQYGDFRTTYPYESQVIGPYGWTQKLNCPQ
jgi:hypothetical protein